MVNKFVTSVQTGVEPPDELLTSSPPVTQARKTRTGSVALTERQLEVLEAIRKFTKSHGFAPARSELRELLGLRSQGGVDHLIHALIAKSWVQTEHGIERSIVLLREGAPLYEPEALCPRQARTGLRNERPPEPTWLDYEVLWELFGALPALCLRVRGNDMERAGLVDGAIVALTREMDDKGAITITEGDIVAARVGDDVALRRVRIVDATSFELRPESRSRKHHTVRIDTGTDEVEIVGVVIGRVLAGAG